MTCRTRAAALTDTQLAWLRKNVPSFAHAQDAVLAADANANDCALMVLGPRPAIPDTQIVAASVQTFPGEAAPTPRSVRPKLVGS